MHEWNYKDDLGKFNLSNFRSWIDNQDESPYHKNFIGVYVESKVSPKKLKNRIMEDESLDRNKIKVLSKDFYDNGGIIKEVDGHYFKIGVDSGEFKIHRMFVKKPD